MKPFFASCATVWMSSLVALAGNVSLVEFASQVDGAVSSSIPSGSSFNPSTGLGSLLLTFSGPGTHSGLLYVDHELSEADNGFENELGSTSGSPASGQSWETDEPGFSSQPGDIFDNFLAGTLDGAVGKSSPDDVAMALGWEFILQPGELARLTFLLSTDRPSGGFYLRQHDPDSGDDVYFTSSLSIRPTGVPDSDAGVPLMALGAIVLSALVRRRG